MLKLACFLLGFYEALLGLLNPIAKEVRCLDLQFHFEAFEFISLFFVNNTILYFHTLQSVHLPFPTSLLLPFLKTIPKKKQQEQVTKKFSKGKQAHVGMEPSKTSQTRCERHHNTFTPSLHLVPFCQLCTQKNFLHAFSLFTCTH